MKTNKIINDETINNYHSDKFSKLLSWLPVFSVLAAILISLVKHTETVGMIRQAVLTVILTAALTYYIRISAESFLVKLHAGRIIICGYFTSLLLLLLVPKPEIFCFWMIGGIIISMAIDNKLGLLVQFILAFLMGITLDVQPKMILQNLVVCVLMCILADALKNKATVIYAVVIILAVNVTLAYVINNFVFDKVADVRDYYYSFFSILAVLAAAFLLFTPYKRVLQKKNLFNESQDKVFSGIISNEVRNTEPGELSAAAEQSSTSQENFFIGNVPEAQSNVFNSNNMEAQSDASVNQNSDSVNLNSSENYSESVSNTAVDSNYFAGEAQNKPDYYPSEERTSYEVLLNPENMLLVKLREYSEGLYEHSLKIGELSGRAAMEIGADQSLAMAGGFYHEIGKINGKQYIEEGIRIAEEHAFPKELTAILKEHNIKYDKPNSVEAAIVMLSDNVVSTIEYIEKTGDRKFTPNKIIDNIFQMRMDKGTFDSSGISLKDFKILKEFYQREFDPKAEQ